MSSRGISAEAAGAIIIINGKKISSLSRDACDSEAEAMIDWNDRKKEDSFTVLIKKSSGKESKISCPEPDKVNSVFGKKIIKNLPEDKIKEKDFLDPVGACNNKGQTGAIDICIYSDGDEKLVANTSLTFDTLQPTIDKLSDGDIVTSNKEINFSATILNGKGKEEIDVCYGVGKEAKKELKKSKDCKEDGLELQTKKIEEGRVYIKDLENGQRYFFKIRVKGSTSWSEVYSAEPLKTIYFFETVDNKGAPIEYSCQQTGSSGLAFLFFVLFALLLLGKKKKQAF